MTSEIVEINGKYYIKQNDEFLEIIGDKNDILKRCQLENDIEFVMDRLDMLQEKLSQRDFSEMTIKEIISELKKDKDTSFILKISRVFLYLGCGIIITIQFFSLPVMSDLLLAVLLIHVPLLAETFFALYEKQNSKELKRVIYEIEESLVKMQKKLDEVEEYKIVKKENFTITPLKTYENVCPYADYSFECDEDYEENKGFSRKRKL